MKVVVEQERKVASPADSIEVFQKTHSLNVFKLLHHRSKELYELQKNVESYLHVTSHDLRGPVVQILGLLQLLEKYEHAEEVTELLDYLKKATEGLDGVVHEMNKILAYK